MSLLLSVGLFVVAAQQMGYSRPREHHFGTTRRDMLQDSHLTGVENNTGGLF